MNSIIEVNHFILTLSLEGPGFHLAVLTLGRRLDERSYECDDLTDSHLPSICHLEPHSHRSARLWGKSYPRLRLLDSFNTGVEYDSDPVDFIRVTRLIYPYAIPRLYDALIFLLHTSIFASCLELSHREYLGT